MTKIQLLRPDLSDEQTVELMGPGISAGFPNPAQDVFGESIDLNRELIKHPASTFCARVSGNSMKDCHIDDGDLLVIDKSLTPRDGSIAVCFIDGEFTLKRISIRPEGLFLMPANEAYKPIQVTEDNNFQVWGIVSYVIKNMKR